MNTLGARLKAERLRLGLTQSTFAVSCGAQKTSQINYEADRRSPDAAYLAQAAGLGVDVLFVLTGHRAPPAEELQAPPVQVVHTGGSAFVLTAEEAALVDNFRHASDEGRRALEAASAALSQPERLKPAA